MDEPTEEIKEDNKEIVEEKADEETVVEEPEVEEETTIKEPQKLKKKKFVFNNYWGGKKSRYGTWRKKQG